MQKRTIQNSQHHDAPPSKRLRASQPMVLCARVKPELSTAIDINPNFEALQRVMVEMGSDSDPTPTLHHLLDSMPQYVLRSYLSSWLSNRPSIVAERWGSMERAWDSMRGDLCGDWDLVGYPPMEPVTLTRWIGELEDYYQDWGATTYQLLEATRLLWRKATPYAAFEGDMADIEQVGEILDAVFGLTGSDDSNCALGDAFG